MIAAAYGAAPFAVGPPGVLEAAVGWLTGTVTGSIAAGLCVLAVATVGLMMLAGRLPVREGLRVVIGCFVLLGAPAIAAGLMGFAQPQAASPTARAASDPARGALMPVQGAVAGVEASPEEP